MQTNKITPRQRVILARVRDPRFRGQPAVVQRYLKTRDVVVTRLEDGTRYDTPPENLDVVKDVVKPEKSKTPVREEPNTGVEYHSPQQLIRQLRKPGIAYMVVETPIGEAEIAIQKYPLIKWLGDCAPTLACGFCGVRRQEGELVIRVV
jgi:hypothetical protein